MDLCGFEAHISRIKHPSSNVRTSGDAIHAFDSSWYSARGLAARWMDLIGDYIGIERFVIDGDALIQRVLGDPLLGLAKDGELSFQLLHATQLLEKLLCSFIERQAVFDVVFWECNRHMTTRCAGGSGHAISSAALARTLLLRHMQLNIKSAVPVYVFSDLQDPGWASYVLKQRPMIVLTGDGGNVRSTDDDVTSACVLSQRLHVFRLLCSGISVALLQNVEFIRAKIFSFVYEGRREPEPEKLLSPPSIWQAVKNASGQLNRTPKRPSAPAKNSSSSGGSFDALLSAALRSLGTLEPVDYTLVCAFVLHMLLLEDGVPLKLRVIPDVGSCAAGFLHPDLSARLSSLLPRVFNVINTLLLDQYPTLSGIGIDCRVFIALLGFANSPSTPVSFLSVCGPDTYTRLRGIWSVTGLGLRMPGLSNALCTFPPLSTHPPRATAENPFSFPLPFDNPVINAEMGSISIDGESMEPRPESTPRFGRDVVYHDVRQGRPRLSALPRSDGQLDAHLRQKALRREQIYMKHIQKSAESLAAATGLGIHQQLIASAAARTSAPRDGAISTASVRAHSSPMPRRGSTLASPDRPSARGTAKGKAKPLSKKEALLQQIQAQKASARLSESEDWWAKQLSQIETLPSLPHRLVLVQNLSSNKRVCGLDAHPVIALEYTLYRISLDLQMWISEPSQKGSDAHDAYTVRLVRDVLAAYWMPGHSASSLAALDSVMLSLGFAAYIPSLRSGAQGAGLTERPMSFKFVKLIKSSKSTSPVHPWMHIADEDPVLWQLRVFGEFMDRSMDSQPDHRVPFKPDAWQRKVLDALDAEDSVLVVAPTSAGKTFISFYAMEQVLRGSDDGILVYVAPTKALVDQIAAEIQSRFSKTRGGKNLWAIRLQDHRINDPENCQILVTDPEVFSTMLLSPSLARIWAPRIKRIILDEIHMISEYRSGTAWEHILLLAPCPVIGLSATIGEPESFNDWVAAVQRAHGFQHTFIHYKHRYSHLRKHVYLLDRSPLEFSGLDNYHGTARLRFLHPFTMIEWGVTSLPEDFTLEACDLLRLYDAVSKHKAYLPDHMAVALTRLQPSTFFSSEQPRFLTQRDVLRFEGELMQLLHPLLVENAAQPTGSALQHIVASLKDLMIAEAESHASLSLIPEPGAFQQNLVHLLADLHAAEKLPAILFSFDRNHCDAIARNLLENLEAAESLWKRTSLSWAQKLRDLEVWESHAKERSRAKSRMNKAKSKQGEEDDSGDVALHESEAAWEASFDPHDALEQFSFAGRDVAYLKTELEELRGWDFPQPWALPALRRGIGVHHSGMNKRYLSVVERLFRLKLIRVIISTETLALGINAPARTTVFCGDSPYLTALRYRQCAGRAGRRGFDLLGNVVFYGLPMDRIQRLVLSRLPPLPGTSHLTPTLALRLCNLLEGSGRAPVAVQAVRSIMRLPQYTNQSAIAHEQTLYHLRFCIDYLRRIHLLDRIGRPLPLVGISARLYASEPSNFALVVLLQNGVLHRICARGAKRELMLILCNLFGRRYLPSTTIVPSTSTGCVVLPGLPADAQRALSAHSRAMLPVFSSYAHTYAKHAPEDVHTAATQLPLSKLTFSSAPGHESPFIQYLRKQALRLAVRCPFAATSGHDDTFSSVEELKHSAADSLQLSMHDLPSMEHFLSPSIAHGGAALNAYLLDFYTHGQAHTLARENGIRPGEVWYALDDFSRTLRSVRTTLSEIMTGPAEWISSVSTALPDVSQGWDASESEGGSMSSETDPSAGVPRRLLRGRPLEQGIEDQKVLDVVSEIESEFNVAFRKYWA